MVHVRNLRDDRYVFEPERYCLRGMRTGKIISLGDTVHVLIKSADLVKKQIDFELAGEVEKRKEGAGRDERQNQQRSGGRKTFSETSGKEEWNPGMGGYQKKGGGRKKEGRGTRDEKGRDKKSGGKGRGRGKKRR